MSLKSLARSILGRAPKNSRWVLHLYHDLLRRQRRRSELRAQSRAGWRLPSPQQVLWIPPERIHLHTNLHRDGNPPQPRDRVFPIGLNPLVVDGDWDLGGIAFEELPTFRAIKAHIEDDQDWRQTDFYRLMIEDIEAGRTPWDCRTVADVEHRFEYIDGLVSSIRRFGLRLPSEVGAAQDPASRYSDEIEVNIGRNGDFLFQDGRHRLAIAKVLGLPRVPVRVRVRHLEWQMFREQLFELAARETAPSHPGLLYQRPTHPDLQDIPAARDGDHRLARLFDSLRVHSGRLIDIGCNLGFFCHHFEQIGLHCAGVEIDPAVARAAERLAQSEHKHLQVHAGDILSPDVHDPLLAQGHDLVLALNVLHQFLKTRERFEQMQALLGKMRPRQMFLELHRADDPQMRNAYARFDEAAFVAFVQRSLALPSVQPIHHTPDGRTIFSLYREA